MMKKLKNGLLIGLPAAFLVLFSVWGLLKPDQSISQSERRPLASFPTPQWETIESGTFMADFETYTLDQFPLRDSFRTLKAITALQLFRQKDNHDLYQAQGFLAKLEYPFDRSSVTYAAERFRFVYDTYLKESNARVYVSIVPDKSYFLAAKNGYLSMDYDAFFSSVRQQMDFARYLDLTPYLDLSDYYRTDTHWRQEKITDVAAFLVEQMGGSLTARYQLHPQSSSFYGVYAGQWALPVAPDTLYTVTNDTIDQYRVFDFETQSVILVYETEKITGQDPYEVFLSGPKSLLTIENPKATTDKELILFRDSFGSSLAPLLAQGFAKVTVVDIRYIAPELLGRFIDFENKDVLFLYSTSVLNHSITIK